jgi:hypothetical protein
MTGWARQAFDVYASDAAWTGGCLLLVGLLGVLAGLNAR